MSSVDDAVKAYADAKKRPAAEMSGAVTEETNISTRAPLTAEGVRPQKKFYRQRAHCNPLSHNDAFEYPLKPDVMDWTKEYFPGMPSGTVPSVLDIGCGFGGLTLALASILPDKVIMGMEIRAKVRVPHSSLFFAP